MMNMEMKMERESLTSSGVLAQENQNYLPVNVKENKSPETASSSFEQENISPVNFVRKLSSSDSSVSSRSGSSNSSRKSSAKTVPSSSKPRNKEEGQTPEENKTLEKFSTESGEFLISGSSCELSTSDVTMAGAEGGRLGPALSYPCLVANASSCTTGTPTVMHSSSSNAIESSSAPAAAFSPIVTNTPPSPPGSRSRSPAESRRGSPSPSLGDPSPNSRESSVEKCGTSLGDPNESLGPETGGSQKDTSSNRSLDLPVLRPNDSGSGSGNGKVSSQRSSNSSGRKRSTWYQMLNPTYRTRSEDFKRIFKDLPSDERLVVDYSCALQKDILVQGRIYVTQNYLCFYANIFRWETQVQLLWKDVTSVTKEKTALVIPNAIQICTESEKYFFSSFGARDKTYVVLMRTWQKALLDQPLTNQELWQFVHSVYGQELGFSSGDEADVTTPPGPASLGPGNPSPSASNFNSPQNSHDDDSSVQCLKITPPDTHGSLRSSEWTEDMINSENDINRQLNSNPLALNGQEQHFPDSNKMRSKDDDDIISTDSSDTSDSDDQEIPREGAQCPVNHEGRELIDVVLPLSVDEVFTLIFTNSQFYIELQTRKKASELAMSPWHESTDGSEKIRQVAYTLQLSNSLGVKSTRVTEDQTLLACSRAGHLYAVNADVSNAGIPYADTFYTAIHYCIMRLGSNESRLVVHAQVKYKKNVWGVVKTFIEKNTWSGVDEHFGMLRQALQELVTSREESNRLQELAQGANGGKPRHVRPPRRRRTAEEVIKEGRPGSERSLATTASVPGLEPKLVLKKTLLRKSAGGQTDQSGIVTGAPAGSVQFILVFLLMLMVLNGLLYWRLMALEELASRVQDTQAQCSPANLADLRVIEENPQTREDWLNLLRQQEMLHRTEEVKWKQAAATASSLLKQAEKSLLFLMNSSKDFDSFDDTSNPDSTQQPPVAAVDDQSSIDGP